MSVKVSVYETVGPLLLCHTRKHQIWPSPGQPLLPAPSQTPQTPAPAPVHQAGRRRVSRWPQGLRRERAQGGTAPTSALAGTALPEPCGAALDRIHLTKQHRIRAWRVNRGRCHLMPSFLLSGVRPGSPRRLPSAAFIASCRGNMKSILSPCRPTQAGSPVSLAQGLVLPEFPPGCKPGAKDGLGDHIGRGTWRSCARSCGTP